MRTALLYAPGDLRIEQVGLPQPQRGEVLIEIAAAMSCGTDVKMYQRGHPAIAPTRHASGTSSPARSRRSARRSKASSSATRSFVRTRHRAAIVSSADVAI